MEVIVPSVMDTLVSTGLSMSVCSEENVESDDETEVFTVKRRKSRLTNILDDDSDQDSDHEIVDPPTEDHRSDKEETTDEERSELATASKKKKKIIRPVEESDDEDEEPKTIETSIKKRLTMLAEARSAKMKPNDETSESKEEEMDHEDHSIDKPECEMKRMLNDDDLYDAEGSSDDNPDDEGLEDIKKQAKQSLKTKKMPSRPRRANLQQLHSDSQRIVREGRVKLPYHIPQPKTLDEFLGRRKSIPNTLKPADSDLKNILKVKEVENSSLLVETDVVRMRLDLDSQPVIGDSFEVEVANNVVSELERSPSTVQTESEELPDLEYNLFEKQTESAICKDLELSIQTKEVTIQDETVSATTSSSNIEEAIVTEAANVSFSLKKRLSLLGSEVTSLTPKLAGTPQEIICLDEEDGISKQNSGLCDLIKRFVKHTTFVKRKRSVETKEVVLNILKKETDSDGREQLKTECVKVNSKPIEESAPDDSIPGSRLKLLRESLKVQLALKREEARKQRLRLYEMDNERDGDGFQSDNESGKEEEILSDLTDTEESETDDEEIDESIELPEKRKKKSVFVDDEAEDEDGISDGGDDEEDTDLLMGNGDTETKTTTTALARCNTIELFPLSQPLPAAMKTMDQSLNSSLDGSFEMIGSAIPCYQPGGGFLHRNKSDFDSQSAKPNNPFEDSQSLCSQIVDDTGEQSTNLQSFEFSQFANFDTQPNSSQPQLQSSICKKLGFGESQTNMDELFDLCSGKWTDKNLALRWDGESQNTQEKEEELFGLCSGKFSGLPVSDSTESGARESQMLVSRRIISDDELSISSLQSMTVGHRRKKKVKRMLSDSENESDAEEIEKVVDDYSEDEADRIRRVKEKAAANEFFEDEAELSGSDIPSDEDLDINEEDDILEEELGDRDYISDDELRNQVGKVHNKLMLDDDQRQLRIYKELYLEDGELHTDGQGRTRQFRWKNIDNSQTDDGFKISDSEGDDAEEEGVDAEFRVQRHEREKWLTEQLSQTLENDDNLDKDDSQFGKITKKITILSRQNSLVFDTPSIEQTSIKRLKNLQRRGSFLSRSKEILAKIAEQTKSSDKTNPNGPRNSRNFVFAAISPTKLDKKPLQVRRTSTTPASSLTAAKRPRLDKRSSLPYDRTQDNSIFNLL